MGLLHRFTKSQRKQLEDIEEKAYEGAKTKRKKEQFEEAKLKAQEQGDYYGSTTIAERTKDRAQRVARAAEKAAKPIKQVAKEVASEIHYKIPTAKKALKPKKSRRYKKPTGMKKLKKPTGLKKSGSITRKHVGLGMPTSKKKPIYFGMPK